MVVDFGGDRWRRTDWPREVGQRRKEQRSGHPTRVPLRTIGAAQDQLRSALFTVGELPLDLKVAVEIEMNRG